MCADYKAYSTVETLHDPEQLTFIEELESFPIHNSQQIIPESDPFQRILDLFQVINNSNDELPTECLQQISYIFANEISGNIDYFLENYGIIENLFSFFQTKNGKSISTTNCIQILNILALITKISPASYVHINKNINTLTMLLRSPDLLPRVVTIFLYSIDGAPQMIEHLILNINLISFLSEKYFEIKDSDFASQIITLISILFEYISFDNLRVIKKDQLTSNFDEEDADNEYIDNRKKNKKIGKKDFLFVFDNAIITYEGFSKRYECNQGLIKTVNKLSSKLHSLINTLDKVDLKESKEVDPVDLFHKLKIIRKYLECFATQENFYYIMRYIKDSIDALFNMPFYYDPTGKVFSQVLAIYDRILSIRPQYFLPDQSALVSMDYYQSPQNQLNEHFLSIHYVDFIFEYITKLSQQRLDLLFLLSNIVKFPQVSKYILINSLITKSKIFQLLDQFSYNEKENALIVLLTIMFFSPQDFYNEIGSENFEEFIDISIETVESTTADYFIQMFLCSVDQVLTNTPFLFNEIDKDSFLQCLSSLTTHLQPDIARRSQYLIEKYLTPED